MSSKYKAVKTTVNGIAFDSKREADRYIFLRLMEKAGKITDLRMQVRHTLIPAQRIGGKVVERAVEYKSDFEYDQDGKHIVEDAKGVRTKDYIIKRKLMLYMDGIQIKEV